MSFTSIWQPSWTENAGCQGKWQHKLCYQHSSMTSCENAWFRKIFSPTCTPYAFHPTWFLFILHAGHLVLKLLCQWCQGRNSMNYDVVCNFIQSRSCSRQTWFQFSWTNARATFSVTKPSTWATDKPSNTQMVSFCDKRTCQLFNAFRPSSHLKFA